VLLIARDFFILIAILVLNILILRVISQMVKARRELFRDDGGYDAMQAAIKAEKKKLIMSGSNRRELFCWTLDRFCIPSIFLF
jgi:hypothetical protein